MLVIRAYFTEFFAETANPDHEEKLKIACQQFVALAFTSFLAQTDYREVTVQTIRVDHDQDTDVRLVFEVPTTAHSYPMCRMIRRELQWAFPSTISVGVELVPPAPLAEEMTRSAARERYTTLTQTPR